MIKPLPYNHSLKYKCMTPGCNNPTACIRHCGFCLMGRSKSKYFRYKAFDWNASPEKGEIDDNFYKDNIISCVHCTSIMEEWVCEFCKGHI